MKKPVIVQEPPRLLDVKGAAAYLSTTVWQIRTLVWAKKLPVIRLGKKLLFDRVELNRFVESLKEVA